MSGVDHKPTSVTEEKRPICPGCGNEIDPDCCGCGDSKDGHSIYAGHPFIPMGCDCFRDPPKKPVRGYMGSTPWGEIDDSP